MKKILLFLMIILVVAGCSSPPISDLPPPDTTDSLDIAVEQEFNKFIDVGFPKGDNANDPVTDRGDIVVIVNSAADSTNASGTGSTIIITNTVPVSSTADPNRIPATEYTLEFIPSSTGVGEFKVSVEVNGVEDIGSGFTSFKWDSTVPNGLVFTSVLPGDNGVTNKFAGIGSQLDPNHWKYGRVGGYTSSFNAARTSGTLVDMFYTGNINLASEIVYFNLKFNHGAADGYGEIPVAENPQIDLERQLVKSD